MKNKKIVVVFLSILILSIIIVTSSSNEYSFSFKANDSIDAIICPDLDKNAHCVTIHIDGDLKDDAFLIISDVKTSYVHNKILIKKGIVNKETFSDWYDEPMSIKYVTTTPNNKGNLKVDISFGYY